MDSRLDFFSMSNLGVLAILLLISPYTYSGKSIRETSQEWLVTSSSNFTDKQLFELVTCTEQSYECTVNRLSQAYKLIDQESNRSKAVAFNSIYLAAFFFNEHRGICPIILDLILLKFYVVYGSSNPQSVINDQKYVNWILARGNGYLNEGINHCGLLPEKWKLYLALYKSLYCKKLKCKN